MSKAQNQSRGRSRLVTLGLPAVAVLAAVSIAVAVFLGNGGGGGGASGGSCPARPAMAAALEKAATGEVAAVQVVKAARNYSDLPFTDANGKQTTLASYAGQPILVNFWASWCVPCRAEMPELDALTVAYDKADFQVVPINLDLGAEGADKAQAFLDDEGLHNIPVLTDPTMAAFERLKRDGVTLGLPATLLLDEKGCGRAVLQGPADWNGKDAHKLIDTLIAEVKADH